MKIFEFKKNSVKQKKSVGEQGLYLIENQRIDSDVINLMEKLGIDFKSFSEKIHVSDKYQNFDKFSFIPIRVADEGESWQAWFLLGDRYVICIRKDFPFWKKVYERLTREIGVQESLTASEVLTYIIDEIIEHNGSVLHSSEEKSKFARIINQQEEVIRALKKKKLRFYRPDSMLLNELSNILSIIDIQKEIQKQETTLS